MTDRLETAQRLAAAFKQQDDAEQALLAAKVSVDTLVGKLSVGRSISREDLRRALDIVGLLG